MIKEKSGKMVPVLISDLNYFQPFIKLAWLILLKLNKL